MEINLEKNEELNKRNLILSQAAIKSLEKTAPWAKFISIIGFFFGGIMIVGAFILLFSKEMGAYGGSTECFIYLLAAFIFIRINLLLYNYSKELQVINYENSLDAAFEMQQKFWKYNGIIAIAYISIVFLALFAFIIGDLI
jgi:hypothetical protein